MVALATSRIHNGASLQRRSVELLMKNTLMMTDHFPNTPTPNS